MNMRHCTVVWHAVPIYLERKETKRRKKKEKKKEKEKEKKGGGEGGGAGTLTPNLL